MAAKKAKKASKTLGKKSMKKTKGGSVFLKLGGVQPTTLDATNNLNTTSNLNNAGNLNFLK